MTARLQKMEELKIPEAGYVLALPGWYPTWQDESPGDFNQRHIIAAALYKPQVVLYITKDVSGKLTTVHETFTQVNESLAEIIVIYPSEKTVLAGLSSNLHFLKLLRQYAHRLLAHFGKPQLLHAYIVLRGGWAARILSKRWNIPYCLSENWTIYYPEDPGYFRKRNVIFRFIARKVLQDAAFFLPVTNNLLQQAGRLAKLGKAVVIPNVVDTQIFFFEPGTGSKTFRFVHVSTMYFQKNPEGLLNAFAALHRQNAESRLMMIGPAPKEIMAYAQGLHLPADAIQFTGAMPHHEVAAMLKQSKALLLFSRYENLPCVILEALCCGLPVVSTAVGGIGELIHEQNGLLVQNEDEKALTEAMKSLITKYQHFNRRNIASDAAAKFSFATVGKQIATVYHEMLHKKAAKK